MKSTPFEKDFESFSFGEGSFPFMGSLAKTFQFMIYCKDTVEYEGGYSSGEDGVFMNEKDFCRKLDEDIDRSLETWDAYSYDEEKMSVLFRYLMGAYGDIIEGICDELSVIQPYEKTALQAEAYRENVKKMLERLEGFRQNGYKNEGLLEYYLRLEQNDIIMDVDFTQLRLEIGFMEGLSKHEKDEIIEKLGEMEEICSKVLLKRQKWDQLRKYLVWLSGKDVNIALMILPIFFKISKV